MMLDDDKNAVSRRLFIAGVATTIPAAFSTPVDASEVRFP
jgi:hypothetical protein